MNVVLTGESSTVAHWAGRWVTH